MENLAIERCAYCRRFVPVTWVAIGEAAELSGRVAVCEACRDDGR